MGERPVNASGEKTKHGKIRIRIRIDGAKGFQQGNRFKTSLAPVYTRLSWRFYRVTSTVVPVQYIETRVRTTPVIPGLCDCSQRCIGSIAQLVYYVTLNVVDTIADDMTTRDKHRRRTFHASLRSIEREVPRVNPQREDEAGNRFPTFVVCRESRFTSTDAIVDSSARDG